MDAPLILTLVLFDAAAYVLAFAAATVLVKLLAGPWRRTAGAHWTERARLAFAPGHAVLWLAIVLPPLAAFVGVGGLQILDPRLVDGSLGFWTPWLAVFAGVLTARYRWLRELWGARVTIRSWLAGCLVLMLVLIPHLLVLLTLTFLLPDTFGRHSAVLFGAAVLAVAFFAFGGGVLLLRLLGVVRTAPPHVAQIVEQLAREMRVPAQVKVFKLEWAQVNAVAWPLFRAVGFSRALLEVMNPDEVRAVAAHELAHLVEPRWVRAVRFVHMFAYLLVAPVMKYGGTAGIPAGWLLLLTIALGYRRLGRRMEVRADRLESEAIADPDTYMRALLKLHEANVTPAVMPGAQTHPHLYDRLLAGGIQPEFPRPLPPSRAKPLLAALAAGFATVAVMFLMVVVATVFQRQMNTRYIDPTADLPSRFKTQEEMPKLDFSEAAKDPKFQQAIKEAAALLGSQPQALKSEAEDQVVAGGVSFEVAQEKVERVLFKAHTDFLARGFYLFRYDQNFGMKDRLDKIGLLPTRDKYAVMAAMDTNGDNYEIGTAGVIAWMKELEQEQPFVLTGIGFDYMEGKFTSPVKDPPRLARRMYQFCPDIVDQGVGNVPALARELEKGRLYFWWD